MLVGRQYGENRLHSAASRANPYLVCVSYPFFAGGIQRTEKHIKYHLPPIQRCGIIHLVESIPGIGQLTAAKLLRIRKLYNYRSPVATRKLLTPINNRRKLTSEPNAQRAETADYAKYSSCMRWSPNAITLLSLFASELAARQEQDSAFFWPFFLSSNGILSPNRESAHLPFVSHTIPLPWVRNSPAQLRGSRLCRTQGEDSRLRPALPVRNSPLGFEKNLR